MAVMEQTFTVGKRIYVTDCNGDCLGGVIDQVQRADDGEVYAIVMALDDGSWASVNITAVQTHTVH